VGAGDTVNFTTGTDNIASLWNSGGTFDGVYGSNNTVWLSDADANVIGGGDTVEFTYGSANIASLFNTGGAADTIGAGPGSGTIFINNAQANVNASGLTIDFTSAGANSVNTTGAINESFVATPISGTDSITGYNATDQVYLSASQFGTSWTTFFNNDVSQSGANTLITDSANHANVLALVGVAPSSLTSANFHFG
jgi:hypothetical protein